MLQALALLWPDRGAEEPSAAPAVSPAAGLKPAPPARTRPAPSPVARTANAAQPATAAVATGTVQLAISPWGEVEVNGVPAGTTPPLTRLTLPAGMHTITLRNGDSPAHTTTVEVGADKPVTVRHRF